MLKRVFSIFLILIALFAILWSSNYIYNKQLKKQNLYSFSVSDSATFIFIPNTNVFLKKVNKITFPSEINNSKITSAFDYSKTLSHFDFNAHISPSVFISFDDKEVSFIFTNYNLTLNLIKEQLKKQLDIDVELDNQKISINNEWFYTKRYQDYFVISTKDINPTPNDYQLKDIGNYDYFIQTSATTSPTYYKHNAYHNLSFWITEDDTIKGQPIKSNKYFKSIPSNFDTAFIYNSTRFKEDVNVLTKNAEPTDFYNWVKGSVIHLKKGSLELMIGEQNDNQYLKDILDEQTLELSEDSLLPTPIHKNNYAVHFFKSMFNWENLLPNNSSNYSVFTEVNNLNIIASSSEAMDWYIKEIQLGNTYHNKAKGLPLPIKSHYVQIINSDSLVDVYAKTWINKSKCFNAKITTNQIDNSTHQKISLVNSFMTTIDVESIEVVDINDSIYILASNHQSINCYNEKGVVLWTKQMDKTITNPPKIIDNTQLLVFTKNQIDLLDVKTGQYVNGFPIQLNANSNGGLIIKYDENSDYRILVNEDNQINNYNFKGKPVEGWNNYQFSGELKGEIHYHSKNQKDYIYFKDSYDTVHVLNRRGLPRFTQRYRINLPNQSPFITGDIEKGNLRCLGYNNNYIVSQFLNDGHFDSLKVNISLNPTQINWIQKNNQSYLIVEEFDKVYLFNEFGLIEEEMLKPQPNLSYLNSVIKTNKLNIFGNINNNDLYLLNNFGKQLNKYPLKGNVKTMIKQGLMISFAGSKIWIYKL